MNWKVGSEYQKTSGTGMVGRYIVRCGSRDPSMVHTVMLCILMNRMHHARSCVCTWGDLHLGRLWAPALHPEPAYFVQATPLYPQASLACAISGMHRTPSMIRNALRQPSWKRLTGYELRGELLRTAP